MERNYFCSSSKKRRKKIISALLFKYIKSILEFPTFFDVLDGVRSTLSL